MGISDRNYWGKRLSKGLCFLFILLFTFQVLIVNGQTLRYDPIADAKLKFLKGALQKDYKRTELWWYGWLGAYSAATIGQGAVFLASDKKSIRQDMALGAATTFLGAAGQFISPFIPNDDYIWFKSLPESSNDERLAKLAVAEKLLNQWGERERKAWIWDNHILPTTVNLAGGLITWLGFKRTLKDGIINFAMNTLITETQIWIQPNYAKRYYKKYCREFLTGTQTYSYVPDVNWYVEAKPGGIGLKVTF